VLAGGVGVGGDGPIEICDQVVVSGMTHVSASITEPGIYSGGVLHSPSRQWKRNALRFARLDRLFRRVADLEKKLGDPSDG
jgi:UDP-3-O-[3-hydroxymyristoyl] glucosamine N-acyltransferase